tara:strand:+ start:393 stop:572 length:180 start_codon:yes stop_codon:yes gene_type:complete
MRPPFWPRLLSLGAGRGVASRWAIGKGEAVACALSSTGLAFAGKNAIAPPDPAPDTFWR